MLQFFVFSKSFEVDFYSQLEAADPTKAAGNRSGIFEMDEPNEERQDIQERSVVDLQ
jgi:hypothetical protein